MRAIRLQLHHTLSVEEPFNHRSSGVRVIRRFDSGKAAASRYSEAQEGGYPRHRATAYYDDPAARVSEGRSAGKRLAVRVKA